MKRIYLLTIILLSLAATTAAQNEAVRTQQYNLAGSALAIQGYDPVSYFSGKPVEGEKSITYAYNGVVYRFTSAKNRDLFKASPQKYEPQYGGWCAYAMGENGEKVEIDPETYKIVGGKLYLFYNKFFNNTLKSWNKDETRLKTNADKNWKKFEP